MKLLKPLFLAIACIVGTAGVAHAEQHPKVIGDDSRVQLFDYDPNTVYVINARLGYSSLIQLGEGEEIDENSGLGMGDAKAWSVGVKGRNIFFKPVTDNAETNIVLVTNKRTYAFQLNTIGENSKARQTYIARFVYPAEPVKPVEPPKPNMPLSLQIAYTDVNGNQLFMDSDINTKYYYRGDMSIKPTNAWDNGRFTYLRFNNAKDLPAVYRLLPDKTEAIINSHVEDDTLVIQEIGVDYRLRFGEAVGEVRNQAPVTPKFNTTGTSSKDFVRVMQGE